MSSQLLTTPIRPLILRLSLPSMLAMVSTALCTLLDALLLGQHGAHLTAASAISSPLLAIIQTLGFTLGMGAGSFVSRCLGSGDHDAAQRAASAALVLSLGASLLLCGAGILSAVPLSSLLGADSVILTPAAAYMRYVLLSGPLLCLNLVLSSLLRAQGKTAYNMIAFVSGAVVSITSQFLLIPCHGIHGAGISMLVREGFTFAVLTYFLLYRRLQIRPRLSACRPTLQVLRSIMQSGTPTLLRQGLVSLSAALLTRTAATFGSGALAGIGLSTRALSLVAAATIGFGQGFAPVCGAAFGAGMPDRIHEAYRFCMRTVLLTLAGIGAGLFIFAGNILRVLSSDAQAFEVAKSTLRIQSITLFAQGAVIMMNMLTQAMGMTLRASIVATSRQGFMFIPLLIMLVRLFGLNGLIYCQSVSDLCSLALCRFVTRGAIRDCGCAHGGCSDAQKGSR